MWELIGAEQSHFDGDTNMTNTTSFDSIITEGYAQSRGFVVDHNTETQCIIFTRIDRNGARVWDVVDYSESEAGSHKHTTHSAKDARFFMNLK